MIVKVTSDFTIWIYLLVKCTEVANVNWLNNFTCEYKTQAISFGWESYLLFIYLGVHSVMYFTFIFDNTATEYKFTCIFVWWPSVWWPKKILIFNIYEMLSGSYCLDVCCFNAFVYYQIFWADKVLQKT